MPGPEIAGTNHVSRLCGGSKCDDDGRPLGSAFMLRQAEGYLSVNWLECNGPPTRADQLTIIRRHLTAKGLKLPASGRLAVLHLQTVIGHVRSRSPDARTITAHHEPELPADPSHAGIYGYTAEDDLIADLIAESVAEVHKAKA